MATLAPTSSVAVVLTTSPSASPSVVPSTLPSSITTSVPSVSPTISPSTIPSIIPSYVPSESTSSPSSTLSLRPSTSTSTSPSSVPSTLLEVSSNYPSLRPSISEEVIVTAKTTSSTSLDTILLFSLVGAFLLISYSIIVYKRKEQRRQNNNGDGNANGKDRGYRNKSRGEEVGQRRGIEKSEGDMKDSVSNANYNEEEEISENRNNNNKDGSIPSSPSHFLLNDNGLIDLGAPVQCSNPLLSSKSSSDVLSSDEDYSSGMDHDISVDEEYSSSADRSVDDITGVSLASDLFGKNDEEMGIHDVDIISGISVDGISAYDEDKTVWDLGGGDGLDDGEIEV